MADDREEIAEAARAVVEGVAEANSDVMTAEAALEAAEARAEAAEEIAEQLSEAALRDRIVQSVADFKSEIETWRNATNEMLQNQLTEIRNLAEAVANLRTDLDAAKANPPAIPALSIPPASEAVTETLEQAETVTGMVVTPESAESAAVPVVLVAPAARRQRHWF